jgi:PDZ domain-containing protein
VLRRRPVFTLALSLAAALAVAAAVLWLIPSDYYLVRPARAQAVDPLVSVPGESREERTAGIYMVAVRVSRASLFERFFPEIYGHADLVPEHVLNPTGVTDTERRQQGFQQMSHSQKVAVVVALRELGYTVRGGAVIARLAGNAPARGTLRPRDVVIEAEGETVDSPDDLVRIMRRVRPGETVDLVVRRGKRKLRLQAETKADPDEPGRALLGVFLGEPDRFRFPVDVRITTPGIGGPSAGLAFALDILDERGRDLDHGRTVVATGELSLGGRVLPIGEIQQKTIGAREAGADVFLVPDENAAEARKHAQGLRIVAVSNFHEALAALTTGQLSAENSRAEPCGNSVFFVGTTLNRTGLPS